MTKAPKRKPDIELMPDAWPRLEQFIRDVAKAGPQHRTKAKSKTRKNPAKRRTVKKSDP
jgi:hypothetical protein